VYVTSDSIRSCAATVGAAKTAKRTADTKTPETLTPPPAGGWRPGIFQRSSPGKGLWRRPAFGTVAILGIDTVAIVVSDRRQALAWYRDVLGLEVAYIGPNDPAAKDGSGTPEDPGH